MIIKTSLLYILGFSIQIGALLAQNQITVTEGSTAELNCTFKNVQSQEPYIVWRFNTKVVFERKGREFIAGDGYEGRVDVPEKKLRNGDCTLVMENVSLNDTGEYESFLVPPRPKRSTEDNVIQRVKLVVKESPEPPKEVPVPPNNDGKVHGEKSGSSNDAGMKRPHPVIIHLSVVMFTASCLLL